MKLAGALSPLMVFTQQEWFPPGFDLEYKIWSGKKVNWLLDITKKKKNPPQE